MANDVAQPRVDDILGAEVRTGIVTINGGETSYIDSGRARPDAATIVLVHGTGGSTRRHFPFLFPMLAPSHRVVSVELSTPPGEPTTGQALLAQQVLAVIDDIGHAQPICLVGYSLGAVVAATAAATGPDRVDSLVLCAAWMVTDTQQRLRNDVWQALRGQGDAHARYQTYCAYSAPFLALRTPAELGRILGAVAADDDTAQQMRINRAVDLTTIAPTISCPTLIVAGTDDQMTPRRQSKTLFGAIPDARYTEVTSGHAMLAERPAELVHLINTFSAHPQAHQPGTTLPARRP